MALVEYFSICTFLHATDILTLRKFWWEVAKMRKPRHAELSDLLERNHGSGDYSIPIVANNMTCLTLSIYT